MHLFHQLGLSDSRVLSSPTMFIISLINNCRLWVPPHSQTPPPIIFLAVFH